jgi:hypothetical protein
MLKTKLNIQGCALGDKAIFKNKEVITVKVKIIIT